MEDQFFTVLVHTSGTRSFEPDPDVRKPIPPTQLEPYRGAHAGVVP